MHTHHVRYVPNKVGNVPSNSGLGTVQTVTLPPEEDIAMRKLSLHKSAGETVQSSEEEHVVTAVSVTATVLPVRRTVKDVTLDWAAGKDGRRVKGVARQIRVHVRAPFGRQTQLVVRRGNMHVVNFLPSKANRFVDQAHLRDFSCPTACCGHHRHHPPPSARSDTPNCRRGQRPGRHRSPVPAATCCRTK